MRLEDLGMVGNCQFSALIGRDGNVAWCCLPRFDAEPIFGALLDEKGGGRFVIGPEDGSSGEQRYLDNTNILETTFRGPSGSFRVLDFAPRFRLHDRNFRPTKLIRIIEPLSGAPRVRVLCEPILGWSKAAPRREIGSHHISYFGFAGELRLTTDVPLSYMDGPSFALTERKHLVLAWGEPVEEPLLPLCERFFQETQRYWQRWVKECDVPPRYQSQVIRSALALKLHCFEDTGAIVAATTTSLPESVGAGRNWDYRYCWLRDAYYVLNAFRLLGHFEEREQFCNFLFNVASTAPDLNLAPLYRIDGRSDLDERTLPDWAGFEGEQPVRVGNAAFRHQQNDVFGEMVLALTPIFLDDRFLGDRTGPALELVTRLARKAIAVAGTPDAGIWEYRTESRPQTFSSLMSWAAADRMATIAGRHQPGLESHFRAEAARIRSQILTQGFDPAIGSLVATYGGADLDASLLQAITLRLFDPGDPRAASTVDAIVGGLDQHGWLLRYRGDDGFGPPSVAFVICNFWLVQSLAALGRKAEAAKLLDSICAQLSPLGLIAEDLDTVARRMRGNFPQAYSHVGLIHAAFAASPPWDEFV
jgi:GH15 family glucan-1,4-alpha-glucosidase